MTTTLDAALSRLRDANPMPADAPWTESHAQTMLTRILDSAEDRTAAEPDGPRDRRPTRRLALAGAVATAAAAMVAGGVPMPWSNDQASSAAYAVTVNADGTVDVTVHWSELHDPDALNARLQQAGVRAAVMLYSAPGQCSTPVALDPAFSRFHVDMTQHPELANDPRAFAAYMDSLTPWIDSGAEEPGDPENVSAFTIHPDAIPGGDQLLVLPRWLRPEGATTDDALELRSLIVPALPQCVPGPEDSVLTTDAIEPR